MRARATIPVSAIVVVFLWLEPRVAHAQDTDIETRERTALAACDSGKTREGIEILGRLYADTLEPTYVYNQGRCYQKSAMAADALNRFREFLRVIKTPNHELADRARQFVRELEAEVQSPAARPALPPATPPAPVSPAPADDGKSRMGNPGAASGSGPAAAQEEGLSAQAAPRGGKERLRVVGYSLAGVGAAALVSGAILSLRVRSLQSELDKGLDGPAPTLDGLQVREKIRSGDRLKAWQWATYLTGAAALTSAGVCLYLGLRTDPGAPADDRLTFLPVLGAEIRGAGLRGTF